MLTEGELLTLRSVLANRRCVLLDQLAVALLDRLAITAAGAKDNPGRLIKPDFLRLLADLHTTIAAIDAALAEFITAGDAP
jgi:hypothetical protein